jgi:dihydroorotate dehydrogenase (NAD+) catalytic subunit
VTLVVGRLPLAHPVLNASGTLDALAAGAVLGDATLGCAAHVTKTITPQPRGGNPPPRIVETPGGMLNSIGLPGPGIDRYVESLPALSDVCVAVPIVTSIGGFTHDDYAVMVERLDAADRVAAIELNLSCPNVKSGCISIGTDPAETEQVTRRCRALTGKPLFVKLSPSVADIAVLALAAETAGADAVVLTNTARGMVINPWSGEPYLGGGGGGLSGPALRPVAVACVHAARRAVTLDIIGVGGITNGQDANEFLAAGANAVAVGTALFRDPDTARRVSRELAGAF